MKIEEITQLKAEIYDLKKSLESEKENNASLTDCCVILKKAIGEMIGNKHERRLTAEEIIKHLFDLGEIKSGDWRDYL